MVYIGFPNEMLLNRFSPNIQSAPSLILFSEESGWEAEPPGYPVLTPLNFYGDTKFTKIDQTI